MLTIPLEYTEKCGSAGTVSSLDYGDKSLLLYTPAQPAEHILYLIHGGGGDQCSFFCPAFLNMVDHMISSSLLEPLYIVSPCFYDPAEKDKTPASSGIAVRKFCTDCGNRSSRWRRDIPADPLAGKNGRSAASPWAA